MPATYAVSTDDTAPSDGLLDFEFGSATRGRHRSEAYGLAAPVVRGAGSAVPAAMAPAAAERGGEMNGVVPEAVADAIDGQAAALAGVEQRELHRVESQLGDPDAEQADR